MDELTRQGIAALKAGDRAAARRYLQAAVKQSPSDVTAWLWLSGAVDSDSERAAILRHVLRIDPGNQAALRGLNQVLSRNPQAAAPAAKSGAAPETAEAEAKAAASPAQPAPPEPEPSPGVGEPSHPVEAAPAPALDSARRRKKEAEDSVERLIFRTRPSLVQALATFWVFFFGVILIGGLLSGAPGLTPETKFLFLLGVGLALELVVLYVVIRRYRMRYELTSQQLTVPFRGRAVKIPAADIFGAECRQSFMQKILSIGDVIVDAAASGELARVRLRDIPDCRKRTEQILSLVKDQQT